MRKNFYSWLLLLTAILIAIGSLLPTCIFAQQLPLSNQYILNRFSLSPAYAGTGDGFEIFGTYRRDWMNVPGAPETKIISADGMIGRSSGLGGMISSQSAGVFQNLSASLSYAYHARLGANQTLSFGLGFGLLESRVNLAGAAGQMNDPVAANNANVTSMVLDAGFGVLYRCKTFHLGVSVPRMLSSQVKNKEGKEVYQLAMQEGFTAGNRFSLGTDWAIDPIAKISMVKNTPLFYEVAVPLLYKNKIWIAPIYKKTSMAFGIGGMPYNGFVVNYSYEFSSMGIMGQSGGTHEITIGWKMAKKIKSEVPEPDSKKPYYKWIQK